MSSIYRTSVISWRDNLEEVWESESLSQAVHSANNFAVEDDEVKVDEVIKDACGEYLVLRKVLEYVKEKD